MKTNSRFPIEILKYLRFIVKNYSFLGLLLCGTISSYGQLARSCDCAPLYTGSNFANSQLVSGQDLEINAVYRFENVFPDNANGQVIDALVQISEFTNGASLRAIDVTNSGIDRAFQPRINSTSNEDQSVRFNITFVSAGGNFSDQVPISFFGSPLDIDGGNSAIREYIELSLPDVYFQSENSSIDIESNDISIRGIAQTTQNAPSNDISTSQFFSFSNYWEGKSTFTYVIGKVEGNNDRQYSLLLDNVDYDNPLSTVITEPVICGNVSDRGGEPLANTEITISGTDNNSATVFTDASGNYRYEATILNNGADVTYEIRETDPDGYVSVSDIDGGTDRNLITKTINFFSSCDNSFVDILRPVAENDSSNTNVNISVDLNVLDNDANVPAAGALSVLTEPVNGTAVVNDSGTPDNFTDDIITYTPNPNFSGNDSLLYRVCDDTPLSPNCTSATARITVNAFVSAASDTASTNANTSVVIDVLDNDTGVPVTGSLNLISPPNNGSASINQNGTPNDLSDDTITYTPDNNISGSDTFRYEICDGVPNCSIADVNVIIIPVPIASDDTANTNQNVPVQIDVLANDTDAPTDGSLDVTRSPSNGLATVNDNGTPNNLSDDTVTYTPFNAFSGSDSFQYEICAGDSNCSLANVNITINETVDNSADTDNDGIGDFTDLDDDNDGVPDVLECGNTPVYGNQSFEEGIDPSRAVETASESNIFFFNQIDVPDWQTTASNELIEIWQSGAREGVTSYSGNYHAELNTNTKSALFQEYKSTPGEYTSISFAHRGRTGVDVMEVFQGPPGGPFISLGIFGTGQEWQVYKVWFIVPPGQSISQIRFEAIATASGSDALGNFIDDVYIYEGCRDTDNDNVPDGIDLDSDNDGIPDALEVGHGQSLTSAGRVSGNSGTNGIPDVVESIPDSETINYTIAESSDDTDETPNYLDLDSDGDGIPDNVEAQTTVGYIAPEDSVDTNGIDTAYSGGITPTNTDGADNPDYLDTDSDNEGGDDTLEAAITLTGNDSDNDGLDDATDATPDYSDVGGTIDNVLTAPVQLPDDDSDTSASGDVDFRDSTFDTDTDNDGVFDVTDLDDDNDGILDTVEGDDDFDGDFLLNQVDLDSDDDGIPDNIEAQTTIDYIAPNADTPADYIANNGVNSAYLGGLTPTNTDGTDNADFLDVDSDNEGGSDTIEAGLTLTENDSDKDGLDDATDATTDYSDVGGTIDNPISGAILLPDLDGDATTGGDVNFRDATDEIPVGNDDTAATNEDVPVDIDVLANDSDVPNTGSLNLTAQPTNGTVTVNDGGTPGDPSDDSVTYTPNGDFNGSDSFTYEICDAVPNCSPATVTLTVNPISDAVNDTAATNEDVLVDIDVLANDSDVPTSGTLNITAQPTNGSVTVNDSGTPDDPSDDTMTYTPNGDFNGSDAFQYEICDGDNNCSPAIVTVTVNPTSDAVNDTAATNEDVPVDIDVLANDSDVPTSGVLNITAQPTNGSVTVNDGGTPDDPSDDTITYTPNGDFNGSDAFTYEICDGDNNCSPATVTLTVNPTSDAVNDTAATNEDVPVDIDVLANDSDVPNTGSLNVTAQPTNGTVAVNQNGTPNDPSDDTITYTPNGDFNGSDAFQYEICDAVPNCSSAIVTVTVNPTSDAVNDTAATNEDVPVDIDVLANDSDVPNTGSLNVTAQPTDGAVTVNDGGTPDDPSDDTMTYTPNGDFNGSDAFQYEICDGDNNCSPATVTVTVNPTSDAVNDTAATNEDVPVDIDVLANDSDVPNTGSLNVTAQPTNGTVTVNDGGTPGDPSDDSVTYTPNGDFNGSDSFTYEICDAVPNCSPATVTLTVNPISDAVNDTAATNEDVPVDIDVLANDSDVPTSGVLNITAQPTNGSVTVNENGTPDDPSDDTITYTPNGDFNGSDAFQYEICDGDNNCSPAIVTVTVNPTSDAVNDTAATNEDVPVDIDVLANDSDVPTSGVLNITAQPTNGTVTVNDGGTPNDPSDDTITYTPNGDFNGFDAFQYEICDGDNNCSPATVTVTVSPISDAVNDTAATNEDVPVDIDVLANDSDVPVIGILTVTAQPANGTATVNENGTPDDPSDDTVTYTPDTGFSGSDSFQYEICDSFTGCGTAAVNVTVEEVITVPVPVAVPDNAATDQGVPIEIDVLANDSEVPNAGTLTVTVQPSNGTATINDNGTPDDPSDDTITYLSGAGFGGVDTFSYQICNASTVCGEALVTVIVEDFVLIPLPVAADDIATTDQDVATDVDVLANDTDVPVIGTLTVTALPANGTATVNENGTPDDPSDDTVTYTPDTGFSGSDSFQYEICDSFTGCGSAAVNITVEEVITVPVPVAADDTYETDENITGIIAILDNDSAVPTSGTLTITQQPANGNTIVNNNGTPDDPSDDTVTYTPDTDFSGTDSFQYEICNSVPNCNSATVQVTVQEVISAAVPQANDDTITTDQGVPIEIDVLANDSEVPTVGSLIASIQASNGTVTINENGTPDDLSDDILTYTPNEDFIGVDSFTYEICNEAKNCSEAAVEVIVQEVIAIPVPVATDDTASTDQDVATDIDVLDNDTDVPTTGVLNITGQPVNGTVTVNGNGTPDDPSDDTVTYSPDEGFNGNDSFTYEICNSQPECGEATVVVNVIGILIEDTDGDGIEDEIDLDDDNDGILDTLEANVDLDGDSLISQLDLDSDGDGIPDNVEAQTTIGYIPPNEDTPADYLTNNGVNSAYLGGLEPINTDGTDNPDYLDFNSDNQGGNDIDEAGLALTGNDSDGDGLDDATDATPDYSDVGGTIDNPLTGPVQLPDSDNDASNGGDVDFRDAALVADVDGDGILNTADLDDDNDGILDTLEANVDLDGDSLINQFDLDSDGDGIPDNVEAQTTVGYIAPNDDTPADYLTNNGVNSAYLEGLEPINTDGTDNPDYLDLNSDNQGGNDIDEAGLALTGNDSDGDGLDDATDATPDYSGVGGTIDNPLTGPVQLPDTDNDASNGGDVDFRDATSETPAASNDTATTDQGLAVDVDVLANDTGVPVIGTLTVTAQPANGTATVNDNGTPEDPSDDSVAYTPQAGFSGNDSFAYEICDDAPNCSTATVTVTVQGTTEVTVPQAADDTYETEENTGGIVAVLDNDPDVPTSGTLTISQQPASGTVTVNDNGTPDDPSDDIVTYTPDTDFSGTDSFQYEICDAVPNCDVASVLVTVRENIVAAPVPQAADDTATTDQGLAVDVDVLANDTGVPVIGTLTVTAQPANGTATVNDNGTQDDPSDDTVTYIPNTDFSGTTPSSTKSVTRAELRRGLGAGNSTGEHSGGTCPTGRRRYRYHRSGPRRGRRRARQRYRSTGHRDPDGDRPTGKRHRDRKR